MNPEHYPNCNFEIGPSSKKAFFNYYQNMVCKEKYKGVLGITEVPGEIGYWRLDFDFKWKHHPDQEVRRLYTDEMILQIIETCRTIMEDVCLNLSNEMLTCMVLEKPSPRISDGYIKDGFHLRFPHFIVTQEIGNKYLRVQLIEKLENLSTFEPLHNINKITDIVDEVMSKNWLLYGSAKNSMAGWWKLTKIFDKSNNEISLTEAFPVALAEINQSPEYYLPSLLSVTYTKEIQKAELKKGLIVKDNKPKIKNTYTENNRSEENVTKDLTWISESGIMDLLSQNRCDNYTGWLDVGYTLYCIGQGHPAALEIWNDWSEGSEKYKEGCCEKEWVKMIDRGKTIGSLKHYASEDSPEAYRKLIKEGADKLVDEALRTKRPTHLGIARIIHKIYGDKFKCTDSKHNTWLEFRGHIWRKLDEGQTIKIIIVRDIRKLFYDYYESLKKNTFGDDDDDEDDDNDKVKKKCKKILNVVEALEGTPFIEGVMRGCKILFHDDDFKNKQNSNKDLYAFKNGVYDLKLNIFREGVPDDCITMQSQINYREPTELEMRRVHKWLRQLFPNPNIRKYWVRCHATTFQGGNRDKKIWMNTGAGWAGKSGAEAALEKIHGPHRFKIPHEALLLNDSKNSQGPNVALWRGRHCRLLMTEEIGENQQLNMGLLKKWSGGDSLYARTHREEGEEFDPNFKFDMFLNKPPRIPSKDKALFTRIRLIDFVSRFGPKDDGTMPPEDEDEQFAQNHFPANPSFKEEELPLLVEPLAYYFLQDWPNYLKYGLEEPEEVRMSTAQYEKENDTFLQFIDDKLCNVEGEKADKAIITMTEMKNCFNDWFKEQYPSYKNTYGLTKIRDEISLKFRPLGEKGKWYGVKFKTENEGSHVEDGGEKKSLIKDKESKNKKEKVEG